MPNDLLERAAHQRPAATPRGALAAARAARTRDGQLHLVDFGDLAGLPRPIRQLLGQWPSKFHVMPRTERLAEIERGARGAG